MKSLVKQLIISTVVMFISSLFAGRSVIENISFTNASDIVGWSISEGEYISPVYSNRIEQLELAWSGTANEMLRLKTLQNEEFAAYNTSFVSSSILKMFQNSNIVQFKVSVPDGVVLDSCSVIWLDPKLSIPTNIVVSNRQGDTFDLSWDKVENATSYHITIWTNKVEGFKEGNALWQETFARVPEEASTSAFTETRFKECCDNDDWSFSKVYPTGEAGTVRIGNTSTQGWLKTGKLTIEEDEQLSLVWQCRIVEGISRNMEVYKISNGVTNLLGEVVLTEENKKCRLDIDGYVKGDEIIFYSLKTGSHHGIIIGDIKIVTGYDAGYEVADVIKTITVSDTDLKVEGMPAGQKVCFNLVARGGEGTVESFASESIDVDLSEIDEIPVLALSANEITKNGYALDFQIFEDKESTWSNGITLKGWTAYQKGKAVEEIKVSSGMSGKSSGLYAYHGTNRNETASYSLSCVANSANTFYYGMAITNDMAVSMENIALSFKMRQWTFSGEETPNQKFVAEYLITNQLVSVIDSGDWKKVAEMESVDSLENGGDFANYEIGCIEKLMSNVLDGVQVSPGEILYIRFYPENVSGGEVWGIDDVELSCEAAPLGFTLHVVCK